MNNFILLDTNILVYAHDSTEKEKHQKAKSIIEKSIRGEINSVVCLQNLSEFFFVMTRKVQYKKTEKEMKDIIEDFITLNMLKKIQYSEKTLLKAIAIVAESKTDFWDALIAATMLENNITTVYTENTKDFEKIKEITTINPF